MSRDGVQLLLSCGEPSGDLYGAELVRQLRLRVPALSVFGLGGDQLRRQDVDLLAHVRDLAVVGLAEVLSHLWSLRAVFRSVLAETDRRRPDLAVLIDYPDFNLRLARELCRRGVPVVYYVSPQLWAWRRGRVRQVRDTVRRMLVIFPFEEELYREAGIPCTFVGHPLVDLVRPSPDPKGFLEREGLDPERPVVGVLPGSRSKEVRHNLRPLAGAIESLARQRPQLQFLLAVAPSLDAEILRPTLAGLPVRLVADQTQAVLSASTVALVASGTATVEAALLGTPMVVVYRVAPVTYALGRPFVSVSNFAMVNLIAGRKVVPELMQRDFTSQRVAAEALSLLEDGERMGRMRRDLEEVRRRLGEPGASARAAEAVMEALAARERR